MRRFVFTLFSGFAFVLFRIVIHSLAFPLNELNQIQLLSAFLIGVVFMLLFYHRLFKKDDASSVKR